MPSLNKVGAFKVTFWENFFFQKKKKTEGEGDKYSRNGEELTWGMSQ